MKQVIGRNSGSTQVIRELSIQVTLDGFSFAVVENGVDVRVALCDASGLSGLAASAAGYDAVYVGWATDMVQVVPAAIFDADYVVQYQTAANMVAPNSAVLYNDTLCSGVVAVWSAPEEIYSYLAELFGVEKVYHYHNIQADIASCYSESVRVTVCEGMANIVICSVEGLQCAEAVAETRAENLLYYATKLNSDDHFARHSLWLTAADCAHYVPLFDRSFTVAQYTDSEMFYHNFILQCE